MHEGVRIALRHVDEQQQAHDLVGDLVLADDERVVVLPAGRGPVEVPRSQVRAMRRVPPRVVRPTSRVDDLERLVARGWPGLDAVRMGGWTLHTGDGSTNRANSCHPTGDPERPLDVAVDQVTGFYRRRGLVPCFQVAHRREEPAGELDDLLEERGWRRSSPSLLMVADLHAVDEAEPAPLEWADQPGDEWLGLGHERSDPSRVAVMTAVPAHYGLLRNGEQAVGRGRLVMTADWGGLGEVLVADGVRGRGHGRALTVAMTARARGLGARWAWLQVLQDNTAAIGLYQSLGFVEHHRYHYRRLVSPSDLS